MAKMDIEKFVDLVERMREAQTTFFKTHNRNAYQRSIILERLCDERIKEYRDEQRKNPIQRDMFEEIGQ